MRALIFDGTKPGLVTGVPDPQAADGEAVVRTIRAGVSSTDLAICRGLLGFSGVLGHEFVGVVESVRGQDANQLTGTRVVGSIGGFCGRCDLCQAGLSQHCRERTLLGIQGRDGCLAERFVIPASNLVPVPGSVDDDHAVFAEPLAAAIQSARQLTIVGKPYITVLGDGPLGLLMVQVMTKLNASVRLVGHSRAKLTVCEKLGVKHRHADDVGRRADQDIVVDCTGAADGLELAMQLVRPLGTIVLKSLLAPGFGAVGDSGGDREAGRTIDLSPLVLNEIKLVGSHRGPLRDAVTMLERREIDVVSLISKRMNLDDGPSILNAAANPDSIKVLVNI